MYNLGSLYGLLNKLKAATHYLARAHVADPSNPKPILGLAIIMLKQRNYNDWLEFSIQAFDPSIEDEVVKISLLYLNALSWK